MPENKEESVSEEQEKAAEKRFFFASQSKIKSCLNNNFTAGGKDTRNRGGNVARRHAFRAGACWAKPQFRPQKHAIRATA